MKFYISRGNFEINLFDREKKERSIRNNNAKNGRKNKELGLCDLSTLFSDLLLLNELTVYL